MSDDVDRAMTSEDRRRLDEFLRLNDTGPVVEALTKGTRLRAEDTDLLDRPYRPRVLQLPPHLISDADAAAERLRRRRHKRRSHRYEVILMVAAGLALMGLGVVARVLYVIIFAVIDNLT